MGMGLEVGKMVIFLSPPLLLNASSRPCVVCPVVIVCPVDFAEVDFQGTALLNANQLREGKPDSCMLFGCPSGVSCFKGLAEHS